MLLAEAASATDPIHLLLAAVIGSVLTILGSLWKDHRSNKLQQQADHAKWLRERRQQVFDAIATLLIEGPPEDATELSKFRKTAVPLAWLDSNGELYNRATSYADLVTDWFWRCGYAYDQGDLTGGEPSDEARNSYRAAIEKSTNDILELMRHRMQV